MMVWVSFLGYWISRPKSYEVTNPIVTLFFCWNVPVSSLRRFSWGTAGGSLAGLLNFVKDLLIIRQAIQDGDDDMYNYGENDKSKNDDNNDENDTNIVVEQYPLPSYLVSFRICLTIMAFSCALGGFYLLVRCMKRYDAPYSATMFVGSYVLSASIMSFIHYDTFQHLNGSTIGYILYPLGLLILLSGVFLLMIDETTVQKPKKMDRIDDNLDDTDSIIMDEDYHQQTTDSKFPTTSVATVLKDQP
jgi:hypothetical protein